LYTVVSFAQPNDNCSASVPALPSNGNCVNSTLYNATNSGVISLEGTPYDVWFKFTATASVHTVTVSYTNPTNLKANNSFVEAFNGSCDGTSIGSINTGSNLTLFGLSIGTVYYVRVFTTSSPNS